MLIPCLQKRGGGSLKRFVLHGISHAAEKKTKKRGGSKPTNPRLLCKRLVCASASRHRHRLVMAAERDRRFYTGKSSGNKGATLAALKHQTDQREALGCNVGRGFWGGSWCLGWAPSKKKKENNQLLCPDSISSLHWASHAGHGSLPFGQNKFHSYPLKSVSTS